MSTSSSLTEVQFKVPFDTIRAEQVEPAIDELLQEAAESLDSLIHDDSAPTYRNTLAALERLGEKIAFAIGVVGHLESVATYPELRAAYNQVRPKVSAFFSAIPLNDGVWRRVQEFAATDEAEDLGPTKRRFLSKTLDDFRRSGAELDAAGKQRLLEINVELARLTTKFAENVLDATNAFDMVVTDEQQLAGLPETAVAAARESAAKRDQQGWRFTLQAPSYLAVMTYLDDAGLRERMFRAHSRRAADGRYDNRGNIDRILALRREKSRLLGYESFADLVLEDRMAKSAASAWGFVNDLRARTQDAFQRENEEVSAFAGEELQPWDVLYAAEKLRKLRYDFDEEDLRPYFPYEGVLAGLFEIANRLFEIRVEQRFDMPVWNSDVKVYNLLDADGSHLGSYYADYFPREDKRDGAWMDSLITGEPREGGFTPHLGLNCGNLTPPTAERPALLTHREVETVFHEFGHLLHHLLSRVSVKSLAGTNVAWDWVELPSQIMENWCWEREALDLFAKHYRTGEPIPEDLYLKLRRAKNFRSANAQMRQLGFATLDLALHTEYDPDSDKSGQRHRLQHGLARLHTEYDPDSDKSVVAFCREILQRASPAILPEDYSMVTAFTHLFASPVGYGAGYYSYKWSEMLDADAFTRFAKDGVFSAAVGDSFRRNILERGNSAEPEELFRRFMGRDPDPEALLRRLGLAA